MLYQCVLCVSVRINIYIAIDGDNTGKRLEKYILSEDLAGVREFSNQITRAVQSIESLIREKGGEIFILGGDNILAYVKDECINYIIRSVNEVNTGGNYSFSVGLGSTLKDVYLALKYSKSVTPGSVTTAVSDHGKVIFKSTGINEGDIIK